MGTQQMLVIITKNQPPQNKKKTNRGRGRDLHISMNSMSQIIIGLIPTLDQYH